MRLEKVYPCIPLRGVSIFPNTVIHFDIGREKSIRALEKAMAGDRMMFVSSQKDDNVLIPTFSDIFSKGLCCSVFLVFHKILLSNKSGDKEVAWNFTRFSQSFLSA